MTDAILGAPEYRKHHTRVVNQSSAIEFCTHLESLPDSSCSDYLIHLCATLQIFVREHKIFAVYPGVQHYKCLLNVQAWIFKRVWYLSIPPINFDLIWRKKKDLVNTRALYTSPTMTLGEFAVGAVQKVTCPVPVPCPQLCQGTHRASDGAAQGEGKAQLCHYRVSEVRQTEGVSVLTSPNYSTVQLPELSLLSDFTVRLAITYDCAPARAVSKNKPKPPPFFFFLTQ